ncbi:MAG: hypothetical protein ACHP9Y_03060 [Gammaproteobacteria bacterium]
MKASAAMEKLMGKTGALKRSFQGLDASILETKSGLKGFSTDALAASRSVDKLKRSLNEEAVASARSARSHKHFPFHTMGHMGMGGVGTAGMAMGAGSRFAGAGLGVAIGGGMLVHAGWEQGKEYQRKRVQFRALGFNKDQIKEVEKLANTPTKGFSQNDLMEAMLGAQMATRNWQEAKQLYMPLAKFKFGAQAIFGQDMTHHQVQSAIRFAEIRAGSHTENIGMWQDILNKMYIQSSGTLKPTEQLAFARRSASVSRNLTPEGYLALEPVIQELGGGTAGSGFRTAYNLFAGQGSGTAFAKKRVEFLEKLGLIHATKFTKTGRPLSFGSDPAMLKLLGADPEAWVRKYWLPALIKQGIVTPEAQQAAVSLAFGSAEAQKLIGTTQSNLTKTQRARELAFKTDTTERFFGRSMKTQAGAERRTAAAWHSMAKAFSDLTNPTLTSWMNKFSSAMENLARAFQWMHNNKILNEPAQKAVKDIGDIYKKKIHEQIHPLKLSDFTFSKMKEEVKTRFDEIKHGNYLGLQKEVGLQNSPLANSSRPAQITMNINGRKVAEAIIPEIYNMLNRSGTDVGPTNYVTIRTPTSTSLSNPGGL